MKSSYSVASKGTGCHTTRVKPRTQTCTGLALGEPVKSTLSGSNLESRKAAVSLLLTSGAQRHTTSAVELPVASSSYAAP